MNTTLVVEDTELNGDLMVQLVQDGHVVVVAFDGAERVSRAIGSPPDHIFLDLSLPGLDGWEANGQPEADELTRQIPIVAVTVHVMASDEEMARAARCNEYLVKPIFEDASYAEVARWLGGQW